MKMFSTVKCHVVSALNTLKKGAVTLAVGVGAGLTVMLGQVQDAAAALPAAVSSTVTTIQADGQSIFDLVFPVVGTFLGLVIIIKLFKRFGNKI